MLSIIVAISDNYAIGRAGDMPWHISADLKYFKRVTAGHAIIMGRRTWESIGCRPLKNRFCGMEAGALKKCKNQRQKYAQNQRQKGRNASLPCLSRPH